MSLRNEVLHYTPATVTIYFAEDHICCALCPLLETYARKQCRRTGEYIIDDRTIGYYCPLNFNDNKTEENINETV